MVFGIGANGAVTVRSTSITSFCGKLRVILVSGRVRPAPGARQNRLRLEADNHFRGWADKRPPPLLEASVATSDGHIEDRPMTWVIAS
jgi:hypothetical protein